MPNDTRLAACALNFFASSRMDEDCRLLAQTIGEMTDEEIEESVRTSLQGLRPAVHGPASDLPEFGIASSYQVILENWPDADSARAIASAISTILSEAGLRPSLVEAFVFTDDFMTQAGEMLRLEIEESSAAEHLQFLVTEEPTRRGRAFMKTLVAQGLLEAEGTAQRNASAHLVVSAAAQALYVEAVSLILPAADIHHGPEDEIAKFSTDVASLLGNAYISSRLAARFNFDLKRQYEVHTIRTLAELSEALNSLRAGTSDPGHLKAHIAAAVVGVRRILVRLAQWLGHIDGTHPEADLNGELSELLASEGLFDWASLLRRDLRSHEEQLGTWETSAHFAFVGRHGERLLWHFGVYLWIDTEGEVQTQVANDASLLQFRKLARFDMTQFTEALRQYQLPPRT